MRQLADAAARKRNNEILTDTKRRIVGYVRDVVIILGIMFGAMYFYEHPEKFDAFMYWLIGYRYRY
jgi:hypothetical protein